jgi:hypothetical protein
MAAKKKTARSAETLNAEQDLVETLLGMASGLNPAAMALVPSSMGMTADQAAIEDPNSLEGIKRRAAERKQNEDNRVNAAAFGVGGAATAGAANQYIQKKRLDNRLRGALGLTPEEYKRLKNQGILEIVKDGLYNKGTGEQTIKFDQPDILNEAEDTRKPSDISHQHAKWKADRDAEKKITTKLGKEVRPSDLKYWAPEKLERHGIDSDGNSLKFEPVVKQEKVVNFPEGPRHVTIEPDGFGPDGARATLSSRPLTNDERISSIQDIIDEGSAETPYSVGEPKVTKATPTSVAAKAVDAVPPPVPAEAAYDAVGAISQGKRDKMVNQVRRSYQNSLGEFHKTVGKIPGGNGVNDTVFGQMSDDIAKMIEEKHIPKIMAATDPDDAIQALQDAMEDLDNQVGRFKSNPHVLTNTPKNALREAGSSLDNALVRASDVPPAIPKGVSSIADVQRAADIQSEIAPIMSKELPPVIPQNLELEAPRKSTAKPKLTVADDVPISSIDALRKEANAATGAAGAIARAEDKIVKKVAGEVGKKGMSIGGKLMTGAGVGLGALGVGSVLWSLLKSKKKDAAAQEAPQAAQPVPTLDERLRENDARVKRMEMLNENEMSAQDLKAMQDLNAVQDDLRSTTIDKIRKNMKKGRR